VRLTAQEGQAYHEAKTIVAVVQGDLRPMPLGNGFDDHQAQTTARYVSALTTIEIAQAP